MEFALMILRIVYSLSENHKTPDTPNYFRIENEKLSKQFFQIAFERKW